MTIEELLKQDEGDRQFAYCDKCGQSLRPSGYVWICGCYDRKETPGNLSIGVGHNLSAKGLNQEQRDSLLNDDLVEVTQFLVKQPFYLPLDPVRREVLQDMAFNLGTDGLMKFTHTIAALEQGNYSYAAIQILASQAARELPERYARLAHAMRSGKWPSK